MGCKYACICSDNCLTCSSYEPEEYVGHAEDFCDELYNNIEKLIFHDGVEYKSILDDDDDF